MPSIKTTGWFAAWQLSSCLSILKTRNMLEFILATVRAIFGVCHTWLAINFLPNAIIFWPFPMFVEIGFHHRSRSPKKPMAETWWNFFFFFHVKSRGSQSRVRRAALICAMLGHPAYLSSPGSLPSCVPLSSLSSHHVCVLGGGRQGEMKKATRSAQASS